MLLPYPQAGVVVGWIVHRTGESKPLCETTSVEYEQLKKLIWSESRTDHSKCCPILPWGRDVKERHVSFRSQYVVDIIVTDISAAPCHKEVTVRGMNHTSDVSLPSPL